MTMRWNSVRAGAVGLIVCLAAGCDNTKSGFNLGANYDLSPKVHVFRDQRGCLSFTHSDTLAPIWPMRVINDGCVRVATRLSRRVVVGEIISLSGTDSCLFVIDLDTGTLTEASDSNVAEVVSRIDKGVVVPARSTWNPETLFQTFK